MKSLSLILSCALALSVVGCASTEPEATAPEATTGAEAAPTPVAEAEPAPVAEAAPTPTPAAPPVPPPPPAMPKTSAVVQHKVKDFDAWKPLFDAHEQARRDIGAKAQAVMREVKNPKSVAVWMALEDPSKLDAFGASDDVKAKMKEAGVIGKPVMTQMTLVDMSPPAATPPKFGAMIEHKAKDFAAWKAAFDGHAQTRTDAGLTGYAVHQNPTDPNHVYVWLECDDQAKLEAFLASKDLKAKMKEAGVKGAPKITVVEMVEFKVFQ